MAIYITPKDTASGESMHLTANDRYPIDLVKLKLSIGSTKFLTVNDMFNKKRLKIDMSTSPPSVTSVELTYCYLLKIFLP